MINTAEIIDNKTDDTGSTPVSYIDPNSSGQSKTIVIGSGPTGIRFAHELLKRQPFSEVIVFGNEPYQPYNRVQLSALLAGEIKYEDIHSKLPAQTQHPNFSFHICAIKQVNPEQKTVEDAEGKTHHYDNLVIATGARPHVPNIPGANKKGTYTFRNLKDTEALFSRISRARHVVVLGGGLLGLEAARALLRHNTEVTVIQQGPRLMNRQLDDMAAAKLQEKVEAMGINVITSSGVREIVGDGRVEAVITRDKYRVECDTVLVCAGIKPNMEIARQAKIKVARGIVVNDNLQTSSPDIYAIGECCEHRGETYGLVNPGFEQAAICADLLSGGHAKYIGSLAISRLKVVGESVCSMGEVAEIHKRPRLSELTYHNKKTDVYRKIVILKGKIIGALAFGDWQEQQRIQESYQNTRRVWPWQYLWFMITGNLFFGEGGKGNVNQWPLTTVICQCNNITHQELVDAKDKGYDSVAKMQAFTGAGTICGSCKPLLEQLSDNKGPREKEKAWSITFALSFLAIIVSACISFIPALTQSDSVQTISTFESIWTDKFFKQVTGFSLLGMSLIGLLMSIKKNFAKKKLGDFAYWRLFHITLGVLCTFVLILHTGLHFGENLNRMLMIDFMAILVLGAVAGSALSLSHKLKATHAIQLRRFWSWAHILVTWPLPILLGTHILTVYYF